MTVIDWNLSNVFWGFLFIAVLYAFFRNIAIGSFASAVSFLASLSFFIIYFFRSEIVKATDKIFEFSKFQREKPEAHTEYWSWNVRGDKVLSSFCNLKPLCRLFGTTNVLTPTEFLNNFHPSDRTLLSQKIQNSIQKNHHLLAEVRGAGPLRRWYLLKGNLTRDRKGSPLRLAGVTIDITPQKITEARIMEVEGRFKALANSIPALTWLADEYDQFIYYNRAWLDFVGQRREEDFQRPWTELIHPDDRNAYLREIESAHHNKKNFNAQFRMLRFDGEYRWMWYSGIPRTMSDQSQYGYLGSLVDITDQMLSEKSRKEALQTEQRIETLMKIVGVGIFQTDENGHFIYVNEQWTKMTGLSKEDSLRENWLLAIHTEDRSTVYKKWKHSTVWENQFEFDCRLVDRNGRSIWVTWMVAGILSPDGQHRAGYTGTIVDITNHKELEESLISAREGALEGSRLKSAFVANMSHEIRTPLNAVIGLTGLLLKTNLDQDQLDYANIVKVSAEALLSLVNDTLDFSKVEANHLTLENINFDLSKWFQDSTESFMHMANMRGLRFISESNIPANLHVQGDPSRLRQILSNLLTNAIKFTNYGTVSARASLVQIDQTVHLTCEVLDTGIGIPNSSKEQMFQPFSQGDVSTTRKYGGTGLGLSICHGLTKIMNGEIAFESEEGKGSRFWFHVPLTQSQAPSVQTPDNAIFTTKAKGSHRFLVVDDNPINQKVAVKILEKMGYYADAVANGYEAIRSVESLPYDLVLMDCQMPEMDGYEATRHIRNHSNLKLRKIPIVAMTANVVKGDREKCLESGMNDYLPKPVRAESLYQIIHNYLTEPGE